MAAEDEYRFLLLRKYGSSQILPFATLQEANRNAEDADLVDLHGSFASFIGVPSDLLFVTLWDNLLLQIETLRKAKII
ncbi:MAG: hypothetical protein JNM88_17005 [Chitinophagaceae bacterium]|nr:hypothetical protein [Chitinophagaceae bacterium]